MWRYSLANTHWSVATLYLILSECIWRHITSFPSMYKYVDMLAWIAHWSFIIVVYICHFNILYIEGNKELNWIELNCCWNFHSRCMLSIIRYVLAAPLATTNPFIFKQKMFVLVCWALMVLGDEFFEFMCFRPFTGQCDARQNTCYVDLAVFLECHYDCNAY